MSVDILETSDSACRQLLTYTGHSLELILQSSTLVTVIQAENLIVQIGSQNNVYIGDHQAQPVGDNQDVDPLEYEEELVGDCHGESLLLPLLLCCGVPQRNTLA